MNHMIHIAATTQIRLNTPGRVYYLRKIAAGKTKAEAMRCSSERSRPASAEWSKGPGHGKKARRHEGHARTALCLAAQTKAEPPSC
jgi:hypothetical protein